MRRRRVVKIRSRDLDTVSLRCLWNIEMRMSKVALR